MTDTPRIPPEPNWADYIDALRRFDPPTLRLARRQRALEAPFELPPAAEGDDADQWWRPSGAGTPRR